VIDATQPLEKQDLHIASQAIDEGRCLVLALNKWDLISNKQELLGDLKARLATVLPQVRGIPMIPLSALSGKNKEKLLDAVLDIYALWNLRISTSKLNRWLAEIVSHHPPPLIAGRRLKIKYLSSSGAEVTEREVIPKEIKQENGRRYLVGYCCLRNDERTFRIDGILHLEIL